MIIDQQFRDLVQQEMDSQGVSRSVLAERMGVAPAFVSKYLGTKTHPPLQSPGPAVMERFFRALDVEPVLKIRRVRERAAS